MQYSFNKPKYPRAPRGWHRIDVTPEGACVVVPNTWRVRRKAFSGKFKYALAYARKGRIHVKKESLWFDNPRLQVHERIHILQEQYWGETLLNEFYAYCEAIVGYKNNPFEVEARMAEKMYCGNKRLRTK